MKKLFKVFLILLGIIGIIYLGYLFLIKANGFDNQEDLVISFLDNLNENGCEEHFNQETISICEVFISDLGSNESVSYVEGNMTVDGMEVTITIIDDLGDETVLELDFTFISYSPRGLRSYFSDDYYLIDSIH